MAVRDATAETRETDDTVQAIAMPHWAQADLRLDPYKLPQRLNFERQGANRLEAREVSIKLDKQGAVLKQELDCGLPLSLSLPSRAFEGVAARAYENEDGTTTVTLELRHADPELSVPLCVSANVEDSAADWHSWSRALNLPMLMVDSAGHVEIVKDAGLMTTNEPRPRRRRVGTMKRRPNFLRRRQVGRVGPVVKLDPAEIIART